METQKIKYCSDIDVIDPESGFEITLEVYRHPNGGLFAMDASFLDQVAEYHLPDPFSPVDQVGLLELPELDDLPYGDVKPVTTGSRAGSLREVRTDYTDDQNLTHLDGFFTDDDGEQGTTLGVVDMDTKKVIFFDNRYRGDAKVLEAIQDILTRS